MHVSAASGGRTPGAARPCRSDLGALTRHATRRAIVLVLAVLALPLVVEAVRHGGDEMAPGTVIGGIDVGGLRRDVARAAVERHARRVQDRGVSIWLRDRRQTVIRATGRSLASRPLIDSAFREAGDRGTLRGVLDRFGIHGDRRVPLHYAFSDRRVEALQARVQRVAGRPPRAASVVVDGTGLRVVAGRAGFGFDPQAFRDELATMPASIELDSRRLPPPIGVAAARAARDEARALIARPPVLTWQGRRWAVPAARVRSSLVFVPRRDVLVVGLDPDGLHAAVAKAFPGAERERRDARFQVVGRRVRVVPDRPGTTIDMAKLADEAARAPGGTVAVTTRPAPASVTAAQLRALGIREVVAEYTTEYACCEPRTTNIARAAALLDGTVIPAGGTFSMNATVGERTIARGFVAAPEIAGGEFVEGVGGGTSQVATTLYNAAFFAGLELVRHTPHGVYISRYPMGREATISWGGPELIFRNDWPAAIYLRVRTTPTSVTVQMFSRLLGRRVETSTGEPTGQVEPKEVRRFDPSLEPGTEVVDQSQGGAGFTIAYTRKVWRGSTLRRDETWHWTYRPVDAYIRYGPDRPEAPTSTAPSAPSTTPEPTSPPASTTG